MKQWSKPNKNTVNSLDVSRNRRDIGESDISTLIKGGFK